ncbi:MAG: carboxypeptidase-like regulatory domain-containing protein [Actinobacteria bacterium]|nr:carboxypeptidase-like regulatory domain-containing protein [Actinomycetota bacterium]
MESVRHVEEALREWAQSVLGPVTISREEPGSAADADVVLYPLALSPRQELRDAGHREPLRFGLRCLVLTQGEDAAGRLQELLVTALQVPDWDVDLGALPPEVWLALGVPPRPSFVVDVEVTVPRPKPQVSLVVRPLAVDLSAVGTLEGRIVGPGSVPIPHARIELVGLDRRAYSDERGHFGFPSVPRGEGQQRFRISAKGRQFVATADVATDGEPLVIRCEMQEE